jgi:RecG-like helicase
MELPNIKLTPTYELKEGSTSGVSNTIESMYLKQENIREEVAKNELIKQKLDIIHDSLNDIQKTIWEHRYIYGRFDEAVMNILKIRRENYYEQKNDIIKLVAKAFCLV